MEEVRARGGEGAEKSERAESVHVKPCREKEVVVKMVEEEIEVVKKEVVVKEEKEVEGVKQERGGGQNG